MDQEDQQALLSKNCPRCGRQLPDQARICLHCGWPLSRPNQEQLALIKEGVNTWNAWRKDNPDVIIDLTFADLPGANLADANLQGALLHGANLEGADLQGAHLEVADLRGANLVGANLRQVNLQRANLRQVNLQRANLEHAILVGANLEGANLEGANLKGANLWIVHLEEANLRNAHLEGSNLGEANLELADLSGANLEGANLKGAFLRGANLDGANLERTIRGDIDYSNGRLFSNGVNGTGYSNSPRAYMVMPDQQHVLARELARIKAAITQIKSKFKISIAHPLSLSKRVSSIFLIHIYLPEMRNIVIQHIKAQYKDQPRDEHIEKTLLEMNQSVILRLSSMDIDFIEKEVILKLHEPINSTTFIARPTDTCAPGEHPIKLSILDPETKTELQSIPFTVTVTDFVFDHISRPYLANATSIVLGIGALAMFILTFVGQVDTTLGLTSGSFAGILASAISWLIYRLYQKPTFATP